MSLSICYLEQSGKSELEYNAFLSEAYSPKALQKHARRVFWYQNGGGYKCVVAILDNKIVGQSCAYKTTAIIGGKPTEWWWGVDTIVLPETRGKGIGKKLQKKLHEDCPNFSSAWYSPANGAMKHRCGANESFTIKFSYYPVSSFFSILLRPALKKLLKKEIIPAIRIPYLYTLLHKKPQGYSINETKLDKDKLDFISSSLKESSDFYIERSEEYLKWKYEDNPELEYIWTEILDTTGTRQALVAFTPAYRTNFYGTTYIHSKILDCIIAPSSELTRKQVLLLVMHYFKKQGTTLDGIRSLDNCHYFPSFCLPRKGTPLLTTLVDKHSEIPTSPILTKIWSRCSQ